jgi:hypothetical protein
LSLCGSGLVLQAAFSDCLFLDLLSHFQDLCASSVIDVGGSQGRGHSVMVTVFPRQTPFDGASKVSGTGAGTGAGTVTGPSAGTKPRRWTADLLTAFNRPHRIAIPVLLCQLADRFTKQPPPVADPEEMASILNRAALLETQFGRLHVAEILCHDQISWVARRVIPEHGTGYAYLGFQPWINLARLDQIRGKQIRPYTGSLCPEIVQTGRFQSHTGSHCIQ